MIAFVRVILLFSFTVISLLTVFYMDIFVNIVHVLPRQHAVLDLDSAKVAFPLTK